MGDVIDFYGAERSCAEPQRWRTGDVAMCGANEVQIVAVDGISALVSRPEPSGRWSIWTRLSNLHRVGNERPPATRKTRRTKEPPWIIRAAASADVRRCEGKDSAEQIERHRREMEWENEGGRVRVSPPASDPRCQE